MTDQDNNSNNEMCNKDTIEEWKFNINRANEIVRLYGNQTAYFVKITLSLIATYNIIYVIFNIMFNFTEFKSVGFFVLTGAFLVYLISAIITLWLSTRTHDTRKKFKKCIGHEIKDSFCYFSYIFDRDGNFKEEIPANLKIEDFRKDYPKQLNNLLKFQKNYFEIADTARFCMRISIGCFIIGLTASIVIILICP